MTVAEPDLRLERRMLREHTLVIACDEVGRGALAGPVAVGAVVIDGRTARRRIPAGLRDSKLVSEARRPEVAARAAAWVPLSAVGWSDPAQIDAHGIITALAEAALQAIAQLTAAGVELGSAVVLLDGSHDYITPTGRLDAPVRTRVKADRDCAGAAAASVIAKVARDDVMRHLHDEAPVYAWARNKGYASPVHRAAIREHGLSLHHRVSWAIADAPTLF